MLAKNNKKKQIKSKPIKLISQIFLHKNYKLVLSTHQSIKNIQILHQNSTTNQNTNNNSIN
jgi:hypothetical protein